MPIIRVVEYDWASSFCIQKIWIFEVDVSGETAEISKVHQEVHEEHQTTKLHPGTVPKHIDVKNVAMFLFFHKSSYLTFLLCEGFFIFLLHKTYAI